MKTKKSGNYREPLIPGRQSEFKVHQSANKLATAQNTGPQTPDSRLQTPDSAKGFSLVELLIAMMVFTVIMGSVITLVVKSQRIFSTEQNAAEVNQNGRLLIDFLTRDIQQSKENGLGLGPRFRSVYSNNGPEGKTDELTIVSSDTDTKVPSTALPLIPASSKPFSAKDNFVELIPNGAGSLESKDVVGMIQPDEEFVVSTVFQDGSIQFDFLKVHSATVTNDGTIGLTFKHVEHQGIQGELPFGGVYENGAFSLRPVTIKRYFIDKSDKEHPLLALSQNDGEPIIIARNVVAFQLRYLQTKEGQTDGEWVKQQDVSTRYRTDAVEVTMTAKTQIAADKGAEKLVTLASVIRPRQTPTGAFGSSGGGTSSPGLPGEGGNGGGGYGPGDGTGTGDGGGFGDGRGGGNGRGGNGSGYGDDDSSGRKGGYNRETKRIGKQPKLGQRLNENPFAERP
jgi:prepilin-type N-terminal cleavage/methylation domain-containing protein